MLLMCEFPNDSEARLSTWCGDCKPCTLDVLMWNCYSTTVRYACGLSLW